MVLKGAEGGRVNGVGQGFIEGKEKRGGKDCDGEKAEEKEVNNVTERRRKKEKEVKIMTERKKKRRR